MIYQGPELWLAFTARVSQFTRSDFSRPLKRQLCCNAESDHRPPSVWRRHQKKLTNKKVSVFRCYNLNLLKIPQHFIYRQTTTKLCNRLNQSLISFIFCQNYFKIFYLYAFPTWKQCEKNFLVKKTFIHPLAIKKILVGKNKPELTESTKKLVSRASLFKH